MYDDEICCPGCFNTLEAVKRLEESHARILTLVEEIRGQVQPVIESLSKSPILRMMGI